MKIAVSVISLIITIPLPAGGETLREFSWDGSKLDDGKVVRTEDANAVPVLMIENTEDTRKIGRLLVIEKPGISERSYAIIGRVKYSGVEGDGYLELWSFFPGGGRYFSRTLADSGPMKRLHGTSDWRLFELPFTILGDSSTPDQLVVNLVLPGRGTVWIGPLRLEEYEPGCNPLLSTGQWWSGVEAGYIGGISGTVLGLTGGLIGILAGRGKARRLVIGLLVAIRIVGLLMFAAGIIAVIRSQPYLVYYPLLIPGGIVLLTSTMLFRPINRRYQELELRKMEARDIF